MKTREGMTNDECGMTNDDQLDELLRIVRANDAWLDSSHAWLAAEGGALPRPLSLGSLDALRLMGLDFASAIFDTHEIALYRWLHIAPLHDVRFALWTGSWDSLFFNPEPLDEAIVAAFRHEQSRLAAILAAVTVTVRARPRKGRDETPPDVIAPTLTTFRAVTIAAALRADLEHVRWHLPVVQALQVYHHALWESGRWTVRPGREATREELADLTPDEFRDDDD